MNLFTEENFAYYDQLLEVLVSKFTIEWFNLDIACKFASHWKR